MTTEEKCAAIIQKMVLICNNGNVVSLEDDFGGNTLTINVDGGHTHVGVPDGDFDTLIDQLYHTLHGGPGLSWHPQHPPEVET